jgi:Flp pilus assembly protein TadG
MSDRCADKAVLRPRRGVRGFLRARSGAAAVEFAIVALPFFWLLFAITEISLMYLTQSALDMAVVDTQRLIRTGEAQNGGLSQSQMKDRLCNRMQAFMPASCAADLYIDVRTYDTFRDVVAGAPLNNGVVAAGSFRYDLGAPDEIVLVRAFYTFKINTPFFAQIMSNVSGDKRLLGSTMLFRTEPFRIP